ncbi:NAD(P)/FAD-dependent oxidoreductase [Actinomycetospora aeridis]|uniref:FAD-dependent oxidoreductase n=1 Tax=Actinomycetospora aeridis TaxID=3129231 RepID=A0ABU8NC44_9PSEU
MTHDIAQAVTLGPSGGVVMAPPPSEEEGAPVPHRTVVLGAGYAGLAAALGLARRLDPTRHPVTVVTPDDHFVERIRLHQRATGQRLRPRPLRPVLAGHGVELVVAHATTVDTDARLLALDRPPHVLGYDDLVLAVGSEADLRDVPGAARHAQAVAGPAGADAVARRLAAGTVRRAVVVGGGLTGTETAAEIAERFPAVGVSLVTAGTLTPGIGDRGREHLRRALRARGVALHEGRRVTAVGATSVSLDGDELPADLVVWAGGFRAPDLLARTGLPVDPRGRLVVDDHLHPAGRPELTVAGDAAAVPVAGGPASRMSCQTGLPMGRYAGAALARRARGRAPRPIRVRYVWQNVGLGRGDGLTQFTAPDDSPLDRVLTGRLSAALKEYVARGAAWAAAHPGPHRKEAAA